jgi:transglutaminase-like putative cysteine protease
MELLLESNDINDYLTASEIIDFDKDNIQSIANNFQEKVRTDIELAKLIYEFVRDEISHSCDINGNIVTCKASSVLKYKQGLCFAKSHLLAALLRAVEIAAGFCYQRLVFDDAQPNYHTLHGFNAIYLASINRWLRVDARGNKPGVKAEFCLDTEVLAFPVRSNLKEIDYPIVYHQPNSQVISALKNNTNLEKLIRNLPNCL